MSHTKNVDNTPFVQLHGCHTPGMSIILHSFNYMDATQQEYRSYSIRSITWMSHTKNVDNTPFVQLHVTQQECR